jgi:RNA polymerase sigma factor (sigma-70 family)
VPAIRLDEVFAAGKAVPRSDPRPDADLLTQFLAGDDGAFEALVVRYTPTLRAACRGWLAAPADIDDAVQATFLILVRRANAIRSRAALGGWLCGVAENVSRRLKGQMRRHAPLPDDVPARARADDGTAELVAVEVARLPEKYRRPVQLCYFGGLTTAEAAERLGWPRNTVLTRLARAKKQLYGRLLARGAAPGALATIAATRAVAPAAWQVWGTVRAARGLLTGATPGDLGLSERTVSVIEGVVHAMIWNKLKYAALAALLTAAVIGFGVGRWATATAGPADDRRADPTAPGAAKPAAVVMREEGPKEAAPPKIEEGKPGVPGKRREAVIRLPVGTYTKDVDVPPYGAGRVTWTYEEDRVLGTIEASVMGFELEIQTEAEYSLSGNGTIYGLLTGFKISHVKFPAQGELAELGQYAAFWPLIEPMMTEFFTDMPFSYQFRVSGDRLSITNYRALLAGPNPLGKLGGVLAAAEVGEEVGVVLAFFQAFGMAMEGNYVLADAKPLEAPKRKAPFLKPRGAAPANPPSFLNRNRSGATAATVPAFPLPREPQAPIGAGTGAPIGDHPGSGALIGAGVGSPVAQPPVQPVQPSGLPRIFNRRPNSGMTLPSPSYLTHSGPGGCSDGAGAVIGGALVPPAEPQPVSPVPPAVMPRAETK